MDSLILEMLDDKSLTNLTSSHNTSIHVAILIKRNKVIATATNKIGSRSRGAGWSDYTIHAEKNVIKEIGNIDLIRGATMYVFRISRCKSKEGSDKIQNSEPCYDCHIFLQKCIHKYGLRKVFYSTTSFVELDMNNCPPRRMGVPVK
jgi:hypothetical protein